MERVLYLSLAILFSAMFTASRKPVQKQNECAPVNREISNETKGYYVVAPERPVVKKIKAISWRSMK
jgi:hypothetical protein